MTANASASNLRHLRAKGEQLVSDGAAVLDRLAGELTAGPGVDPG